MDSYRNPQKGRRREQQARRKNAAATTAKPSSSSSSSSWCCSFKSPPKSPETLSLSSSKTPHKIVGPPISETLSKSLNSFPNSPQSSKSGVGKVSRMDRRRILSPGRVSPIDSDMIPPKISNAGQEQELSQELGSTRKVDLGEEVENGGEDGGVSEEESVFDVRLSLKGRYGGGCLVLELNSKVLGDNSCLFDGLIKDSKKNGGFCRIEVPEVENLGVFRETIELMFEDDITKKLIKIGAFHAIDILEVSTSIKFDRGIQSCLKYLEAVPWTEEEEEKLRQLFTRFKFDDGTNSEIFSRLNLNDCNSPQQNLASQIVRSITTCGNAKARNDLKSMVKGLLSKSSVYEKDYLDISKEDLYSICQCSLSSLVNLFQEATDTAAPLDQASSKKIVEKPLIESISWQVENINWLLEILLDRQMAEDFVDLWAYQEDLLEMHQKASPMVRYELSRVSAVLFVAMGTRKLQCQAESRFGLLNSWFSPMLLDFGWLQRCRKGLNVRELEEAMGQSLLTLPLKQQYALFMEWFRCFSKHGTECPNLSKAFQIWWRRSFLRGSETHAIESR